MKRIICPRCGSPEAANFTFRILCPEIECDFYDEQLAKERMTENAEALEWIELYDDIHYKIGRGRAAKTVKIMRSRK